jgi:hypothetical protein
VSHFFFPEFGETQRQGYSEEIWNELILFNISCYGKKPQVAVLSKLGLFRVDLTKCEVRNISQYL